MKSLEDIDHGKKKEIPEEEVQPSIQETYEEHLLANQKRLREAERQAKLGHWELDLQSDKLHWSSETYKIFELDPLEHEPSLEDFLEMIHPDERDYVIREYETSVENKTQYNVYHRIVLKSGPIKFVNERCRTYYDEQGQPIRSSGTVVDMTNHEKEVAKLIRSETGLEIYANELEDEVEQLSKQLTSERVELAKAKDLIDKLLANKHD